MEGRKLSILLINGCFDLFHEGHRNFLQAAKDLGIGQNTLMICVNTDVSARALKADRHGPKYPIDDLKTRMAHVGEYGIPIPFASEEDLLDIISRQMPCILVKGPDYKYKKITGENIAPVLILDTPEPEQVKQMKRAAYNVSNPLQSQDI